MSDKRFLEIKEKISEFSDKYLDKEFKTLNLKLLKKLEKRDYVSLNRGKIENWTCGIIFAIGQLNFLFERSFSPYVNNDQLCYYFNVKKQNMWIKSRNIRKLLNLKLGNEDFSTKFVLSLNIPDSDDDLKRIHTFDEVKPYFHQKLPHDVKNVKNDKLFNLITEFNQNNARCFK